MLNADDKELFVPQIREELDGKKVAAAGDSWLVAVDSIHQAGLDFWIQLTLTGPATRQVLVKLAFDTAVSAVIPRVAAWLEDSRENRIDTN